VNEGRSALASFGIKVWPIGTPEELRDAGYDVKDIASCAEVERGKVRGCPMAEQCAFDRPGSGGFKFKSGPHYIGFRIIDPADGTAMQDVTMCHNYVLTLQKRADAGAAQRRVSNGRRGEIIRVIAQEGEEIVTAFNVPVNAAGEVINVMPEHIPIFKENGVKFSLVPKQEPVTWKSLELRRTVPHFPRPGERTADTFAHRVAEWEADEHRPVTLPVQADEAKFEKHISGPEFKPRRGRPPKEQESDEQPTREP
jgi:hypothetical protein